MIRQPEWIKECLKISKKFNYKTKNHFFHNAINLFCTFILLAIMAVLTILPLYFQVTITTGIIYFVLGGIILGQAAFGLFILIVHEASHNMYLLSRNSSLQHSLNRLSGWLVCIPLAVNYIKHWEKGHLEHHLRPLEESDPQAYNRLTGKKLFKTILGLAFIPGYAYVFRYLNKEKSRKGHTNNWLQVCFFIFWISLIVTASLFIHWIVAITYVFALQVLMIFNQIKGSLEHGGEVAFHENPFLRSRTSFFLLRNFFLPFNISLHFEHHLNFVIPWYNLVDYHKEINQVVPVNLREQIFNTNILEQLKGRLKQINENPNSTNDLLLRG